MVGKLTDQEIDTFLTKEQFGRLGCHRDGSTYVVPISYVYDGTCLLGQTTLGLKIEMMRANPEVCVEVDEIKDLTNWQSVIVKGRFEELIGIDAVNAMGLLIDKYGPEFHEMASTERQGRTITPPRLDAEIAPTVVYAIHIHERTGRFERSGAAE